MIKNLILILSILLTVSVINCQFPSTTGEFPLTVGTFSGTYQGKYDGNTRSFLGVAYAKPPTGALRFKPPQPKNYAFGLYNATVSAPSCFQAGATAANVNYSEDCLYLDVYTPRYIQRTQFFNLPVMVFIHGGRYWTGSALDFPGNKMAAVGNSIVVIIQYRLNVFGFQPFNSDTNLGLQDQQMALQWVKDNIMAFGGSNNKITIFGESAGGSSVLYHLFNPSSYSLYNRAIVQSAWQWVIPTVATARTKTTAWAATKGCANTTVNGDADFAAILACLSTKDALSITPTAAQSDFFVPMIDGTFITTLPLNSFKLGQYNQNAKIIIGHNLDEGNFMAYSRLGFTSPLSTVTNTTYLNALNKYLNVYFNPTQVADIVSLYEPIRSSLGNWYGGAEFFGDYYITCGSILASQYLNNQQAKFNNYIFDYATPNYPADQWFNAAAHGNELAYVFFTNIYTAFVRDSADTLNAVRMNRAWTDFADSGNPISELNNWPTTYPLAMYYGQNPNLFDQTTNYTKSICESWRVYFEQY